MIAPYLLVLPCLFSVASAFSASSHVSSRRTSMKSSSSSCGHDGSGALKRRRTLPHAIHTMLHTTSSSSLYASTISDNTSTSIIIDYEGETVVNPLKSAGLSFVSASSKSLGMLFYNIGGMDHKEIQALLLEAGTHLVAAGESWTSDWDSVRDSMSDAAKAFYDISDVFGSANIDESLPLGTLFEHIGRELEDISEISGCCAVGPPCSSPNLLAVEEHLTEIAKVLKKNSVAATDEHMMCTLFREVAELFGEMAGRYVDNDGQASEVTV